MLPLLLLLLQSNPVIPLAHAHAHNDYLHPRPLLDALSHGFTSVEADIFFSEGKLLVAHTRAEIKPERTLQKLYLDPLRQRIKLNGGRVYPGSTLKFYLFIDIKTEAASTWPALGEVLAQYADILTEVREGIVTERAVTVVLSGSRPSLKELAAQSLRYAGYDGRLSDLSSDVPAHLMPVVSDNWMSIFRWGGSIPFSDKDSDKLKEIVTRAHAHGRIVRFWATPEKELVWATLLKHRVDLLNTDKLGELSEMLRRTMK